MPESGLDLWRGSAWGSPLPRLPQKLLCVVFAETLVSPNLSLSLRNPVLFNTFQFS